MHLTLFCVYHGLKLHASVFICIFLFVHANSFMNMAKLLQVSAYVKRVLEVVIALMI